MGAPGCPDPAFSTASIERTPIALTASRSTSTACATDTSESFRELTDDADAHHVGHVRGLTVYAVASSDVRSPVALDHPLRARIGSPTAACSTE